MTDAGIELAHRARRVAEGHADGGHVGGSGGGDVDLAVSHHHGAIRPPAGHLDGADQMAGRGLEHVEGVAPGNGGETALEVQFTQQQSRQALELVGAHGEARARRRQRVEQFGNALERPARDRHVVGIEGEERLVQPGQLALGNGPVVEPQAGIDHRPANRGR